MLPCGAAFLAANATFVRPLALENLTLTFVVSDAFAGLHGERVDLVNGVPTGRVAVARVFLHGLALAPAFWFLCSPRLATFWRG